MLSLDYYKITNCINPVMYLISGGNAVVEHIPHHFSVEGLSSATVSAKEVERKLKIV